MFSCPEPMRSLGLNEEMHPMPQQRLGMKKMMILKKMSSAEREGAALPLSPSSLADSLPLQSPVHYGNNANHHESEEANIRKKPKKRRDAHCEETKRARGLEHTLSEETIESPQCSPVQLPTSPSHSVTFPRPHGERRTHAAAADVVCDLADVLRCGSPSALLAFPGLAFLRDSAVLCERYHALCDEITRTLDACEERKHSVVYVHPNDKSLPSPPSSALTFHTHTHTSTETSTHALKSKLYHRSYVESLCARYFDNTSLVAALRKRRTNEVVHQRTKIKSVIAARLVVEFCERELLRRGREAMEEVSAESCSCSCSLDSAKSGHTTLPLDTQSFCETRTAEHRHTTHTHNTRLAYSVHDLRREFSSLCDKYDLCERVVCGSSVFVPSCASWMSSVLSLVCVLRVCICVLCYEAKEVPALSAAMLCCHGALCERVSVGVNSQASACDECERSDRDDQNETTGTDTHEPTHKIEIASVLNERDRLVWTRTQAVTFTELRRELCERIVSMSKREREQDVHMESDFEKRVLSVFPFLAV